ncbi:MAG: glycoside hydrolase family 20 zincin-like fold domain-containing protein [Verrucomicrobia bacterium]|nr:glycoside hydrolase family 20 zincin-like fold domain-containing protein [Verrucomicrobiota bacterium]
MLNNVVLLALSAMVVQATPEILPTPKRLELGKGELEIRDACVVAGSEAGYAAQAIAERLAASVVRAPRPGCVAITLRLGPKAPFSTGLSRDQSPEAYQLAIRPDGIEIVALHAEGLLRAAASLLQLVRTELGVTRLPCLTITDWPDFRYRCASDWLVNVEVNRWAYDWGDGPQQYLARIKRKLDFCFLHKINQVWFDGFGWNVDRFPGYAALMRECNRYARQRGIKLTFAGYGGGYGTAYQTGGIYRHGYFGQTFLNRRPYPDGPQYACRGMDRVEISRAYGTCLSNEALARAKLAELKRFVSEVEPGFLYIHDIDSGTYAAARDAWRVRCDECRRRWPSDDVESPQGQAGAMASWYAKIRKALDPIATKGGYRASRDLTLIFISPLYAAYYETNPPDVWQREVDYFRAVTQVMGASRNVQFGVRELFYAPSGGRRIAELRAALDKVGNGHALHVVSFMGGDNYYSDDLLNFSGIMAPLFQGAESVCLSNGGLHEEPVQVLNAELLWSGAAGGYRERLPDEPAARKLRDQLANGRHRPADVFGPGRLLERICRRLWGNAAGAEMYRACTAGGESGNWPVSHVWFSVTRDVARLQTGTVPKGTRWEDLRNCWQRRLASTQEAITHAERAAKLNADEDVAWFARCLDVGRRFSEVMLLAIELRIQSDEGARSRLAKALDDLESHVRAQFHFVKTDVLGGDPGCWLETIGHLRDNKR